jgi:hypothetical protein
VIEAGVSDSETLQKLEKGSLLALREYDRGIRSLDDTLPVLLEYDALLELPRDGLVDPALQAKRLDKHREMYADLLIDKPWQHCDCVICKEVGVEVIIFRGNDRNRRRGFHNTFAFYHRFKTLLAQLDNETIHL